MENQTSQKKERLLNYQLLQRRKEQKLIEKEASLKNDTAANNNRINELEKQLVEYRANLEKLNAEIADINSKESNEIKQNKQKLDSLKKELEADTAALNEHQTALNSLLEAKQKEMQDSPHVLALKSRLAYLNTEINESNFKIGEYKKEAKREQTLSAQIEKLKATEANLQELIQSGTTSLKRNYVEELEVAKTERESYEKQLHDFVLDEQNEIKRLTDIVAEMSLEATALNNELAKVRQSQNAATVVMQQIESHPEVIDLRKKVDTATQSIAKSNSEIARLTADIDSIRARELEAAKQSGKEQEYLAQKSTLEQKTKEVKAIDASIASSDKEIASLKAQNEKNDAKLKEVEAGIEECTNYNTWVANNARFAEEMYPKALELAAQELRQDKKRAKEEVYSQLKKEASEALKEEIKACQVKAQGIVDSKTIKVKGAIRDVAANNIAQGMIDRLVEKHIDDAINAGTSEIFNTKLRAIRNVRLAEIEKAIASAENRKHSEEIAEAKKRKEMFERAETDNTLLVIKNVRKYFPVEKSFFGKPTRYLKAVDNVSLRVQRGKTLGIVGESGCGKTTMGRTVLRLHDITDGEIIFDGHHLEKLKSGEMRSLRTQLQIIFQDPYSSLSPRLPVGEIIGEAVRAHKLVPASEYKDYIVGVMKSCGLQPHHFSRFPHEFSGGQRQRICIARALAVNPKVVICDEPVSALDVSIQAQIINLLKDLQRTRNLTYIFISHDLSVVEHISDDVGVMYLGSMVESGPKEKIFDNPMHPYTEALLSAVPIPDPNIKMNRIFLKGDIPSPSRPPRGCKFHTRCHKCMDICKIMPPVYREYEKDHFVACHLYPQD